MKVALLIILVIDGFRPDSISSDITPNLFRLKNEGVWCDNSHSVFPTVTRVNSASIATGTVPSVHGIISNSMYVEGVAAKPFDTADYKNLMKLAEVSGGRTLPVTTMAEALQAAGIPFVGISSGSTGGGFLINPMAPSGTGVLINGGFEDGRRVAYPDKIDRVIQQRFGAVKSGEGIPSLLWAERVLREYVLPELHPRVIVDWLTEPDDTQHKFGVGSPEALAVLKTMDQQVGLLMVRLRELGLDNTADIIVTADHGFGGEPDPVDLNGAIQATGKAAGVIAANNGASTLLYAKDHDPELIRGLVSQLQKTDGVDLVFTTSQQPKRAEVQCQPGRDLGWVPGTFSLELIDECRPSRGADVIVTYQWTSDQNAFGFPGLQRIATTNMQHNVAGRSGHGGLNPFMIHTPLVLWGPDFKHQTVVHTPTANFDIAPTVLALEGVKAPASMSGRVIAEAFAKRSQEEPKVHRRSVETRAGSYCATIQLSIIDHRTYVDQGERCR
ncbi:MAG TPA: alkaline phosphatase family protein [Bryobacteraceae bacterium]|jgi:arylsulfatase A-like enzyme|nr:alkaline phosphatase family protein [Bryobacteraceae bacterium]